MDRDRSDIVEMAADWADRIGELTDAERRAFATWLEESPEHAETFARMHRLMTDTALIEALDQAGLAPSVVVAHDGRRRHDRQIHTQTRRAMPVLARRQALAAGLAGALALPLAGYWLLRRDSNAPPSRSLRFASSVGKRRHVVLPDGSALLLDASSAVSVDLSRDRRRVVLEQGAVRFDVSHDASRPFEVHTPLATMVALGTSFSVDHLSSASELRVFSGRVQLDGRDGRSLVLPARQWALVREASWQTGSFDPDAGNDWQNDWLDANSMRLDFAVERLARYSSTPLKLEDPKLANLTFSGRFRLGRPVESLELIGALFGLQAIRRNGAVYLAESGRV